MPTFCHPSEIGEPRNDHTEIRKQGNTKNLI
jgi:hypothetical protein